MCEPMGARGCAEWEVIPIPARSENHLHGERFMAGSCDDRIQRIMILALAIRHRMERPAISMEGGATPMEQFATAVCLTYEKNNIYSGGSSMDKQIEESEPKKQEEILSFGGVAISVKYAEQDNPHITEALKRSVFSYGFYNNICKT